MSHYDEDGVERDFGLYLGLVAENADPLGLGRVQVLVPGKYEPSGWALPVGGAHSSGAAGLGGFDVPPKNAGVMLAFHAGDMDRPVFFGGWKGKGEQVSRQPNNLSNVDKIKVYETERFLIVLNGIGGQEELLVKDKSTGDEVSMKPSQLKVVATQKVTIVAPQIECGADGIGAAPLINGVVLASGIDPFTGATYGALGSASSKVTASKV